MPELPKSLYFSVFPSTVMLIEMPCFQYIYYSSTIMIAIQLIFHICTFYSLDCTDLKCEQNIIEKRMTSSICTKFAHFLVVLVRKYMVQKFLISYRFDFLIFFFSRFFDNSVRAFSSFLFRTEWSEMSLYCYYDKMVIMKY